MTKTIRSRPICIYNTKHKTQDTKHKTQNRKHKTQNTKHKTRHKTRHKKTKIYRVIYI